MSSKIAIPPFLADYIKTLDSQEKRDEVVTQYKVLKQNKVVELMLASLEKELERSVLEDERDDFLSKFASQSKKAKRLGERKKLRQIINYFK